MANAKKSSGKTKTETLEVQATNESEILIPLEKIRFDPSQPRKSYHTLDGRVNPKDQEYIEELARSIQQNEQIQAITVREDGEGNYIVVVGECRTRAHLLLGKPSIRAVVRNDLVNPALRLIYQLAENVNRKDLTDDEMAKAIRKLMEGDKSQGVSGVTQVQIAHKLGKSEGWVSRFVKFGDEELQRVWVHSGIVDTVENLYRLSILPKGVQVEILRRAELSEGDIDRLEKPLSRLIIDEYTLQAKRAKKKEAELSHTVSGGARTSTFGSEHDNASGKMMSPQEGGTTSTIKTGGYSFPEADRLKLLGSIPAEAIAGSGHSSEISSPPVHCRVSIRNLAGLLQVMQDDKKAQDSALELLCELNIPSELAKLIAKKLVGVIVDDQELSAVVQTRLSKLG